MKISEFVEKNDAAQMPQELKNILLGETSIWTNDACYGYFIMALEDSGFARDQIISLLHSLHQVMDDCTPEEAEQHYQKW